MSATTEGTRWVLCIEQERCIWRDSDSIPEVDIDVAYQLDSYDTEDQAISGLSGYLAQLGAKAVWSDVRPTEECAGCGNDFNTAEWHMAVALSEERGPEDAPDVLAVEYPARFCPSCGEVAKQKVVK